MPPAPSPRIYWLFGWPAAGRTELAQALRGHFQAAGQQVTLLDGDELRAGLCDDLGFTESDLLEKARRGAHVAKSHAAAGSTVICSFLTPRQHHRELVRQILGDQARLIHVQCALPGCKSCLATPQKRAAKTAGSPTGTAGDFELPAGADAVIPTHDRALGTSLQALCQHTTADLGTPVRPARPAGRRRAGAATAAGELSSREREVLSLLSQGLRHKEMAEQLGISATTVRTHVERACVKLSASSRMEAVARFVALGVPPTQGSSVL